MPETFPRRVRRVFPLSVAVLALLAGASCSTPVRTDAVEYCAIMPDSVGLYVGNPVTHMGYPIGEVSSISPSNQSVQVNFKIARGQSIPAEAKAVTRSTSILADRALEVVGDYEQANHLSPGTCIPLSRSLTPKTLSEVIGASTDFLKAVNPEGSDNVNALVRGLDAAARNQGPHANELLTTTSSVLDSPDQAIADMATITRNLGQLTGTLNDLNPVTKQVFDDLASPVGDELRKVFLAATDCFNGIINVVNAAAGIEKELGPQVQQLLDAVSVVLRKATPRAPFYASLLNVTPRVLNGLTNLANNHDFTLHYRPPTYRLRAPDGVATCNIMNASLPGSCANVKGTPYAVDVALLQYVLTQAANK